MLKFFYFKDKVENLSENDHNLIIKQAIHWKLWLIKQRKHCPTF